MSIRPHERVALEILDAAGIEVNGPAPWDIQVHHADFYRRALQQGTLGLGESYMDQWWDAEAVDQFIDRLVRSGIEQRISHWRHHVQYVLGNTLQNLQNPRRARRAIAAHYDLGNDLFAAMLDPLMNYSCGYWKDAEDLAQAQRDKLELICRKLELSPGQLLVDIGCGWGGLACYAAENYQVRVVGVTLSQEQATYARKMCQGLPVDIRLQDYRELDLRADRLVSVGMFEHVGYRNYAQFMEVAARCLKEDGLFLLHTIGNSRHTSDNDPWINKYIFPDGELPSMMHISEAMENIFTLEDWHSFGPDYDRTLMAWLANFEQAWPSLSTDYDHRFYRMWRYYLQFCAGLFRARRLHLWQLVLSKSRAGAYRAPR